MPEFNIAENQNNNNQTLRKEIAFHFQPFDYEKSKHYIEKADSTGQKRKYLCGIASGIQVDHHGERMTEECMKDFMQQANTGTVLLYPDKHGIAASKDVGILTKADLLPNGDWYTEYRLYDEIDDVDNESIQTAKKMWKQSTGEPPYKKPLQRGFSIEGYIPSDGIIQAEKDQNGNLSRRVINKVLLDGVVWVPRPAYKTSIATSVYKALGELHPAKIENICIKAQSKFAQKFKNKNAFKNYYTTKGELDETLEEMITDVLSSKNDETKREQLRLIFDEYTDQIIDLTLNAEDLLANTNIETDIDDKNNINDDLYNESILDNNSHSELYKGFYSVLKNLKNKK